MGQYWWILDNIGQCWLQWRAETPWKHLSKIEQDFANLKHLDDRKTNRHEWVPEKAFTCWNGWVIAVMRKTGTRGTTSQYWLILDYVLHYIFYVWKYLTILSYAWLTWQYSNLDITGQYWTVLDNMKEYLTILGHPMKYQALLGCIIHYFDVTINLTRHSNF